MVDSFYILHKVMLAARNFFLDDSRDIGDISRGAVFAGLDKTARSLPAISCYCLEATHEQPASGTWKTALTIQVRSDSEVSTEAEHHIRVETVFNLIADSLFAANLAAELANFGVLAPEIVTSQRFALDGDHWISEVDVDLIVTGNDIA